MLTFHNVKKSFGEKCVLSDASFSIPSGTTAAFFGPSGSGKTTILRMAAGLEKPDSGEIYTSGKIAVSFAEPRLFPHVRVLENVTSVMHDNAPATTEKARKILSALGLDDAVEMYPNELSSGMAARVSLARAIAYDADIYLLDEPFRALDGKTKSKIMGYLQECFSSKTVFLITHDEKEAEAMATQFYQILDGSVTKLSTERLKRY